jgi:two-component system chemotaxis response regulator CheV
VITVCEFNNAIHGFLVDGFDKIHRISWEAIQVPSIGKNVASSITGVFSTKKWEILLLDFEGIITDIMGPLHPGGRTEGGELTQKADKAHLRGDIRVLIVDDSRTMRIQLEDLLKEAGYRDLTVCSNGVEAYETIQSLKERASASGGTIGEFLDVVVSDIEMPRMDGLTLCKKLKGEIPDLSVLILSSMISEQMALKCKSVSADGYLSKMESEKLIALLDDLCLS